MNSCSSNALFKTGVVVPPIECVNRKNIYKTSEAALWNKDDHNFFLEEATIATYGKKKYDGATTKRPAGVHHITFSFCLP
jgi:hypothetical protein